MVRRPVLAVVAAALLVAACSGDGGDGGDAAPDERLPRLSRLHAEPDPVGGGRLVDAEGREVLLRGVNVNALAEYWAGTDFPTTFPLADDDPERMASIGWDAVRLLVSWSRVEREPGRYDEEYLDDVAAVVDELAAAGIYTIIDLHQDAWGATLVADPDTPCPDGSEPALGWDGAPGWATLAGDEPRCAGGGVRELSPAVMEAWRGFFADAPAADGVGVQTRYVDMLGHVARRFAAQPAVAGYDVMNEPNAFGDDQQVALSAFYERALSSIRAGEEAGDGFAHLVLFEPSALWSSTGTGAPPIFAVDENVVYAPHIYTGGFTGGPITAEAFEIARQEAAGFGGAPVLSGEWGADPDRAGGTGDGYFVDHQRLQDEYRVSATLWTWRESCGDPHKVADLRVDAIPEVWGEFDVDCADNSVSGPRRDLVRELTRGYVRAAPGTLAATGYDDASAGLVASGEATGATGPLVAFHPGPKADDVRVDVDGLGKPAVEEIEGGGVLITAPARGGPWELRVTPAKS